MRPPVRVVNLQGSGPACNGRRLLVFFFFCQKNDFPGPTRRLLTHLNFFLACCRLDTRKIIYSFFSVALSFLSSSSLFLPSLPLPLFSLYSACISLLFASCIHFVPSHSCLDLYICSPQPPIFYTSQTTNHFAMSQQGVFGLEVPPGGVLIPVGLDLPATVRFLLTVCSGNG